MNRKALSLLSGGLDSILATKLIVDQGIEVEAIHFRNTFSEFEREKYRSSAEEAAAQLKIPLKEIDITEELLAIVKNPAHGYGSNMNPCVDCRILSFKKAKEYMRKTGASFLITGEVLGERPMSQRREMIMLIEKESALRGLVVRPLSAQLFEETIPEKAGLIDRSRLFGIRGRSRKPQIELARKLGIASYPTPAGGCLLTDPGFAARVRDLVEHDELRSSDVELLKAGRHFRLSDTLKFVVGRNREENDILEGLARNGDMLFEVKNIPGPVAILRGTSKNAKLIHEAAQIISYYTKARSESSVEVCYRSDSEKEQLCISVAPADQASVEKKRI